MTPLRNRSPGDSGKVTTARRVVAIAIRVVAGLLILATLLSAIESNQWWIRIWDFPRSQILTLLIVTTVLALWHDRRAGRVVTLACVLASGWQLYRIYPYTPLSRPELAFADERLGSKGACFSVLSLNVLQSNRDYGRTAALIDRIRPDILLLMETDQKWAAALSPQLARYPERLMAPLDNTYGLIFATRLPMREGQVEVLTEKRTPSVTAVLEAGSPFRVIALHPRPPVPGQDTYERDAEIAIAARRAALTKIPVLALGDFNDVAWSHTSRLFKRIGGYLDARIGRGTYATFPAQAPLLGWPLDHLFATPQFTVRTLRVLEDVGSDHLPIHSSLCLTGRTDLNARPQPVSRGDVKDMREIIDDYRSHVGPR